MRIEDGGGRCTDRHAPSGSRTMCKAMDWIAARPGWLSPACHFFTTGKLVFRRGTQRRSIGFSAALIYADRRYLRKGVVYLPVMKKTEAGFYIGVDPLSMINVTSTTELRQAIGIALARPIPIVPTPPRNAKLNNVLQVTGLRSWSAFDRSAECWAIKELQGIWKIAIQRSRKEGGGDDQSQLITFPPGTSVEEVADRLFQVIQEKARAQGEA